MSTIDAGQAGVIVAIDGGGSKTDAVAVDLTGAVRARARGAASNPQTQGLDVAVAVIDTLVAEVLEHAGLPLIGTGVFVSGLDLEIEIHRFREAVAHLPWAAIGTSLVDNDMFALLRTGTKEANAIAVICGTGINCVGVRADGATARFPALGAISGDWGGGFQLGEQALWHAARASDGRGTATQFSRSIPEFFGLPDIRAVIEAFHFGRISAASLALLSPIVFDAADNADAAARVILDRQATEIVALAGAAIDRLELDTLPVPVVLGGGVLAAENAAFHTSIEEKLGRRSPRAKMSLVRDRPVVGAALLALEAAGATPQVTASAHSALAAAFATLDDERATAIDRAG